MKKDYILTVSGHTIHIAGFCHYVPAGIRESDTHKRFLTEEEAMAYDCRANLCKVCRKKVKKMITEEIKK